MAPKTHVGFVAEFPDDYDGGIAAGYELVDFISSELRNAGYDVEPPSDQGWSWQFTIKSDEFDIYSIVGFVGDTESDPPRQWLMTNDSKPGFLKRIFGGRSVVQKHEEFLTEYCEKLHRVMSSDDRFSHVAWHDPKTFDQPGSQPSSRP